MNEASAESFAWTNGKLVFIILNILVVQLGFLIVLAERKKPLVPPSAPAFSATAWPMSVSTEVLASRVFATDPTVFPALSPHAFAEQAWRQLPQRQVEVPRRTEQPAYLEYTANPLAARETPAPVRVTQMPFQLAAQFVRRDQMVTNLPPAPARAASSVQIPDELALRQISRRPALPDWTNDTLLTNTLVQFTVGPSGLVFSAELLSGSGLAEADGNAISNVFNFRFAPAPLTRGLATFYWKTIAPPATNAPGVISAPLSP